MYTRMMGKVYLSEFSNLNGTLSGMEARALPGSLAVFVQNSYSCAPIFLRKRGFQVERIILDLNLLSLKI